MHRTLAQPLDAQPSDSVARGGVRKQPMTPPLRPIRGPFTRAGRMPVAARLAVIGLLIIVVVVAAVATTFAIAGIDLGLAGPPPRLAAGILIAVTAP